MLSMLHTTARVDRKELPAKKTLFRSGRKGGMATTIQGLCFSYGTALL